MILAIAVCLVLAGASCAPLQPPQTEWGGETQAPDADPDTPSALEQFRERRAHIKDDPAAYYRPWIAVLPFDDESGFRDGVWDLHNGPAQLLSAEMLRATAWRVVPYAAVLQVVGERPRRWQDEQLQQLADSLGADLLLTGVLLDYNMERLSVGDPLIGGYKAYKGLAEIEVHLVRAADLERIGNAHAQQETVDRGLGLDLLGKPREQDYQFLNLGQMTYGSDEFRGTAIGQATMTVMDDLMQQMAHLVRPQGIQVSSGMAQILSVFGPELFINVGSENGLQKGYRFAVYPGRERAAAVDPEERIAVVEVEDIIGARVSRVRALSGIDQLEVGDRLELIGVAD
jgi:hypothetical protein